MDANGSGTQRLYSFRDLLELKLIKQMLDAGLALQSARKAVESLRKFGNDATAVRIVIEGPKVVIAETEEQWLDLMRDGQGVFSFNVAPVAETIQQQLFEMPKAAGQ
jgi:DNA-binding transcriptional MerR regulator